MINFTANAANGEEVWAQDFTLDPLDCGTVQTDLVLFFQGSNFTYAGADMSYFPFISNGPSGAVGAIKISVQWDNAYATQFNLQTDFVDNADGTTSEGYLFDLAFVSFLVNNPDEKFIDEFQIFFNTTSASSPPCSSEAIGAGNYQDANGDWCDE
jgi:hypothetical protein